MNSIKRQNIHLVDLGTVGEIKGHEQANLRPCIVIQPVRHFELAVIIPLTTKPISHFAAVPISKGAGDLPKDSYAMCHQIRTVSFQRIQSFIGILPAREFNKLLTVLSDFLDL